jgi:hypothetical protein
LDFPPGWYEERVRRVLAHYEEQTEVEAVAEDEAALEAQTQTVIEIPTDSSQAVGHALDRFIGTWSAEQEAEVLKSVEAFEQVDSSFWQ